MLKTARPDAGITFSAGFPTSIVVISKFVFEDLDQIFLKKYYVLI